MKNYEQLTLAIVVPQTRLIRGVHKMFKNIAKFGSVLVIIGLLTACAGSPIYHKTFMRGQIVGVEESDVVLCIGSNDGAQVGQTLDVYRISNVNPTLELGAEGSSAFKREFIGEVVISDVVDDHFARASVNSGDVEMHDVVELKK